ncbi:MAG: MTH895/ArsE family thioredoxin-like protein [Hydrogenovibrio sp.]
MKNNVMVRMLTLMVLVAIGLAQVSGQTNLASWNWLWLAVFAAGMGLQATFTGWCPSQMLGKLSKTGECCPGGTCGTSSKTTPTKAEAGDKSSEKDGCCSGAAQAQTETNGCCGDLSQEVAKGCCEGAEPSVEKSSCCGEATSQGKVVKVLGSGCANCQSTAKLIESVAEELTVAIELEKVEDFAEIAAYGVMSTPGVVIDEAVVHSGGIPSREQIKAWLS